MTDISKRRRSADEGKVAASLGRPPHRRHVTVKPSSYQPSKAELDVNMSIDTTPEALACALLRPVKVVEDPDA